ncbi:site-specific integrase [Parafrankia sp. FMc2]|uniref:site-specific integrase n=1 Tax=Parafrankia sp. FMc2 TaxID=3233196 RepID=UPI0034D65161
MTSPPKKGRFPGVTRRCGCADPDTRKKYGPACPKLAANPRHGTWHWRAELGAGIDPQTGEWKERRRPSGTAETATKARDDRQKAIEECREADVAHAEKVARGPDPEVLTVREALAHAMQAKKVQGKAHGTLVLYQGHLDSHILPDLGDLPITALDAPTLRACYAAIPSKNEIRRAAKKQTVSTTTVHAVHRTVRALLSELVRDGVIPYNPGKGLGVETPRRKRPKTWDAKTAGAFLDYVDQCDDELRALWYLALDAGSRRCEYCGFRWSYIDLETGHFEIPQEPGATLVVVKSKPEPSRPKTEGSARAGVVSEATREALKRHRRVQVAQQLTAGEVWSNPEGYVFTRADGSPWHPEAVSRRYRTLVRRAKLPYIPLKNLRHSSATIGLDAGVEDMEDVSRRLGHSSTTITRMFYVGHTPGRAAAQSEARSAAIPRHAPPHHPPHHTAGDDGGTVSAIK